MRILIVRADRLGDVLLTLPMAAGIKRVQPASHVTFAVREYTAPIVRMSNVVDEVLTVNPGADVVNYVRQFRNAKAEAVFFPNARFDQALAAFLARIPMRIGTAFRWYSFLYTHRQKDHRKTAERHEAEYNLRLLGQIGIETKPEELQLQIPAGDIVSVIAWLGEHGLSSQGYVVLHIPSGGSSKDWATERFAELAIELRLTIVLTGLASDAEFLLSIATRIRTSGRRVYLFIGKPLGELAALLKHAAMVISNSTGPGHLAATLGVSAIGLYPLPLALSKERWGLRGPKAINIAPVPIAGCPTCERCTCMDRISVNDVLQITKSFI